MYEIVCWFRPIRGSMTFANAGWYKEKFYELIIWGLSKQWEMLLVVLRKSCLWWFEWSLQRLKLRKLVIKDWVHVFPGLMWGWVSMYVECVYMVEYMVVVLISLSFLKPRMVSMFLVSLAVDVILKNRYRIWTKSSCIASGKINVSRIFLDLQYTIFDKNIEA